MEGANPPTCRIAPNVQLGSDVIIRDFVNLYGCRIGDHSRIGTFVEIQKGACVGKNCKIQSHTFICEGVTIEDNVFVGHNVTFINDRFPRGPRRRPAPDGRGLDVHTHPRQVGRIHRIERNDPVRSDHRRECSCRGRQRRDQRRPARRDRRRQSSRVLRAAGDPAMNRKGVIA